MLSLPVLLKKLTHLRQGVTRYGNAPHKIVFLLTIIDLIDKGHFAQNYFTITPEFVGEFLENWSLLVPTEHNADFTQPLFYLQSERINNQALWTLNAKPGYQIQSHIRSVHILKEVLDYASFSPDVFLLLSSFDNRRIIRQLLINQYFPDTKQRYLAAKLTGVGYIKELSQYLLNEKEATEYVTRVTQPNEQDGFVRSGLFPKLVRMVYNYTCCISGMRLISLKGQTLLEASHIVPFNISGNDQVTNGLSLCPNLHTAFDKGFICIDYHYKVLVSDDVEEDQENTYSLRQLEGKKIILPFGQKHYPSIENLRWHQNNVFNK